MGIIKQKSGWIAINRSITNHWVWTNTTYLKLWVDFLLRANYETNKVLINSRVVILQRGQFITSLTKLSKEYKCSIGKIRHFLNLLQNDSMIELKTTRKFTQITISNYSSYQDVKHTESTQNENKMNTERKQSENRMKAERKQNETENKVNKRNNNNKETKKKEPPENSKAELEIFAEKSIQYQLALLLYNQIRNHNTKITQPDFQSWSHEIDQLIKQDNRDGDAIGEAIFFTQESEFWKNIIRNPKKLRRNFKTISEQMDVA